MSKKAATAESVSDVLLRMSAVSNELRLLLARARVSPRSVEAPGERDMEVRLDEVGLEAWLPRNVLEKVAVDADVDVGTAGKGASRRLGVIAGVVDEAVVVVVVG